MWSQSRSNRCHRSEQCVEQTEPLLLLGPYGGGQPRQGAFIPVRCTLHIQFLHPINNNRVQKLEWRVGWETPMQGTPPPLHGPSTVEPADPREHQPGGFNSSAGVCVALRHRYIWYRVCLTPPPEARKHSLNQQGGCLEENAGRGSSAAVCRCGAQVWLRSPT